MNRWSRSVRENIDVQREKRIYRYRDVGGDISERFLCSAVMRGWKADCIQETQPSRLNVWSALYFNKTCSTAQQITKKRLVVQCRPT